MKQTFIVIALSAALVASAGLGALAQTSTVPQAAPPSSPPADAGAPLSGANSFTENQARSRIEQQGYTAVTGLAKDSEGVWRGMATKDGRQHKVAVDFRGNVVVSQN